MDKQRLQKAVDVLRDYNKWRRGLLKECPNASLVGESIDFVIELLGNEFLNKK
jgi:hypothetical protein